MCIRDRIGNAVKFTEKGEVAVTVRTDPSSMDGELILFTVRDTGIGIPKEKLISLFGTFTQVDSSTTRKYGGTGLGLAISKRLVEMMNGKVQVESLAGQGSTCLLYTSSQNPGPAKSIPGRYPL